MPQPHMWAKSLLPGHQSTGRRATMSSSYDLPPPQSCRWAVMAHFPVPTSAWGREKEEGLPPPQAVSGGLWSWGRGYPCGKLAEAAGSRRESGKNDIKPGRMQAGWRAQAGPGRGEGGREGGGPTEKRRGAGERTQELVWENLGTVTTIPSFLHPQILIEGLLGTGQSARL